MTTTPPRLRLIGRDNGAGLTRELNLTAETLRQEHIDATVSGLPHRGALSVWLAVPLVAVTSPPKLLQTVWVRFVANCAW